MKSTRKMTTLKFAKSVAQRMDRRKFTLALGAGLIAAPFVQLLREERAIAAPGSAKRLIVVVTHGTNVPKWRLKGSSPTNLVFNSWNSGLESVKDKIVVVEGLSGGGAHASRHCLTGEEKYTKRPSLDQRLADFLQANGSGNALESLLLGAEVPDGLAHFTRGGPLPIINDPNTAQELTFGNVNPGSGVDLAALRARQASMLDVVKEDLNELNGMLGVEERPKLEAHLESIRKFEQRLGGDSPSGMGCAMPGTVAAQDSISIAKAHMETARLAVACDVTRVVGVQWGDHNGFNVNVPEIGFVGELHSIEHRNNQQHILESYENWFTKQFAAFVQSVADTADPTTSGSLLDSTLIAWVRGMGDATAHNSDDQRIVLAGGPGILATTPTGRYVDVPGVAYTRGLLTIMAAFGVTGLSDFGDQSASREPLNNVLA